MVPLFSLSNHTTFFKTHCVAVLFNSIGQGQTTAEFFTSALSNFLVGIGWNSAEFRKRYVWQNSGGFHSILLYFMFGIPIFHASLAGSKILAIFICNVLFCLSCLPILCCRSLSACSACRTLLVLLSAYPPLPFSPVMAVLAGMSWLVQYLLAVLPSQPRFGILVSTDLLWHSSPACRHLLVPFCLSHSVCPASCSVLPVSFCLPAFPVLFCLSRFACPVLQGPPLCIIVLAALSAILSWQTCSGSPFLPVLFCVFSFVFPVLPVLFCLFSFVFPILPILFSLSRSGCPVLVFLFWLSHSGCPFLPVLS